ncbi:MAG: hypothetical protein KJ726_07015, partial [Verrucomicrobia bacterium]|nr:hypothetical protein [Verrucomicrobiota bacterium]
MKTRSSWRFAVYAAAVLALVGMPEARSGEDLPYYLADRGKGVTTSLFGTYIRKGEWLVYPFYEYVKVTEEEYHGSELGYTGETDYIGELIEHQALLFVAYGFTENLALELEGVFYTEATLKKAPDDTESGLPDKLKESGSGTLESNLRWRWARETEHRPEFFCNFEVEYPLQKDKALIGAQDWEFGWGLGAVKGFTWGTLTPRISVVYEGSDDQFKFGEYAIEYLKRLNRDWRWVTTLEGEEEDLSIIVEAQWRMLDNAFWKFNCGFGLIGQAPDIAPEVGLM